MAFKSNQYKNTQSSINHIQVPDSFLDEVIFLGLKGDAGYYYFKSTGTDVSVSIDKMSKNYFKANFSTITIDTLTKVERYITTEQRIRLDNLRNELSGNADYATRMKLIKDFIGSIVIPPSSENEEQDEVKIADVIVIFHKIAQVFNNCSITDIFQSGIFLGNKENSLILNSSALYECEKGQNEFVELKDKMQTNAIGDRVIYEGKEDLKVDNTTPAISQSELMEVKNALNSFQFVGKESDANLVLGWIGHAFFSGALEWRTHLSITGARGTGKTTLMKLCSNILGNFAIHGEGDSTTAGIRQLLQRSAKAVVLDESEGDKNRMSSMLDLFRSGSSGGAIYRGSADQTGVKYVLKLCGMIGGIKPPEFNAADSSRFIRLNLARLPEIVEYNKIISSKLECSKLGTRLAKLLILNYFNIMDINDRVKQILVSKKYDQRFCDTNGIVISFSYFMNNYCSPIALEDFINGLDLDAQSTMNEEKDEDNMLNSILSKELITPKNERRTIRSFINQIVECSSSTEHYKTIIKEIENVFLDYDMCIKNKGGLCLMIDTGRDRFKSLLGNDRGVDVKSILLRQECVVAHPVEVNEKGAKKRIRFSGSQEKHNPENVIIIDLHQFMFDIEPDSSIEELQEEIKTGNLKVEPLVEVSSEEVTQLLKDELKKEKTVVSNCPFENEEEKPVQKVIVSNFDDSDIPFTALE